MKKNKNLKSFFETEFQPKIDQVNKQYYDLLINKDLINQIQVASQDLSESKQSYKTKHNEFKYFLSALANGLTIFPLCGLFHKKAKNNYLKLKENKNKLLDAIEQDKNDKLNVHKKIIDYILNNPDSSYYKYLIDLLGILNIKDVGFINDVLIKELKSQSLIDFDVKKQNPYKTHWSIFDHNKIVINSSKQTHYMENKKYIGTRTVYKTVYDSNNNSQTRSQVLYAYHYEPFPIFKYVYNNYFFMQSCSNLEFSLIKIYDGILKKSKRKNQAELENKKFEKTFDFSRNDEVQFRMVFTPLAQERFVNDIEANKDFSQKPYFFSKYSSFVTNNIDDYYNKSSLNNSLLHAFNSFESNESLSYKDLLNNILKILNNFIYNKYLAYLPGYILSIFASENHTNIIKKIINQNTFNLFLGYYCFFNMFNELIIKKDTDTFYKIINNNKISTNLYSYKINALTYNKVPRTTIEYVYSSLTGTSHPVDIHYDEYIPYQKNANLYVLFNDNKEIKQSHGCAYNYIDQRDEGFNNKIETLKKETKLNNLNVSINNNILAIIDTNNFDESKVLNFINKLKNIL